MSELDDALKAVVGQLVERVESHLPEDCGVMLWLFNRTGADLDVTSFSSCESTTETLRIIRATATRLVVQESRQGDAEERYFEAPTGGPASDQLVSAATVARSGGHDRVRIWSRGGLAGELVVSAGDGERIAATMLMLQERA